MFLFLHILTDLFWGLSSAARSVDDFVSLKTPPYLHARVTSAKSFPHMMMEMTFCSICTSICILCECPCGPSGTVLRQQIILKNTTFKKYWQKLRFRPNPEGGWGRNPNLKMQNLGSIHSCRQTIKIKSQSTIRVTISSYLR